MNIEQRVELILHEKINSLRESAPYDTGNLSLNAIKLRKIGIGKWQIYIDQDIAPYMPYTNEEWISPKWNGKQNPNQGWWNNAVEIIIKEIMHRVKGAIRR